MIHSVASVNSSELSPIESNWNSWFKTLLHKCTSHFGYAGQQVIQNKLLDLHPFKSEPSKYDLDTNILGEPIPGQFKYQRRITTHAQVLDPSLATPENQAELPLSDRGNSDLRKDKEIYDASLKAFLIDDTNLLQHLQSTISPESLTVSQTHPTYPSFSSLSLHQPRSLAYLTILRATHQQGNAIVKHSRLREYFDTTQADGQSHASYVETINLRASSFAADFATITVNEIQYISLDELHTLLYIKGLNKTIFQRPLEDLLAANPSGKFDSSTKIIATMQTWSTARAMSLPSDFPSAQGSAYAAVITPASLTHQNLSPRSDTPRKTRTNPKPCEYCLIADPAVFTESLQQRQVQNPASS